MKGWLSGGSKDSAGGSSGLGARMRNALSAMSSGSMNRKVRGTMINQSMLFNEISPVVLVWVTAMDFVDSQRHYGPILRTVTKENCTLLTACSPVSLQPQAGLIQIFWSLQGSARRTEGRVGSALSSCDSVAFEPQVLTLRLCGHRTVLLRMRHLSAAARAARRLSSRHTRAPRARRHCDSPAHEERLTSATTGEPSYELDHDVHSQSPHLQDFDLGL